jgi:hypothetical protein
MIGWSRRIPPVQQDDDDEWMVIFRTLPDMDIEDLLAGRETASPAAAALTDVISTLRSAAHRHGAPAMSEPLRRQIARPRIVPSATRGSAPPRPRRRRLVLGGLVGLAFGAVGVGLAGAQNVLPEPLQDAASSAASVVGIDLPRADDRDGATRGDPSDPQETRGDDEHGTPPEGTPGQGPDGSTPKGPPDSTPGGAVPADPGTPGDQRPATPAIPPEDPGNGGGQGDGQDNGQGEGQGNGQGNGNGQENRAHQADGHGDGGTVPPTGQDNGRRARP